MNGAPDPPSRKRRTLGTALAIVAIGVLVIGTAGDALAVRCRDRKPTTWDLALAPAPEPGDRLVLTGRVIDRVRRTPLAGISMMVYHSDSRGNYNPPGDKSLDARLCGVLITNARGEYRIRTTVPGEAEGTPHIHFEVWGPNVTRRQGAVNLQKRSSDIPVSKLPTLRDLGVYHVTPDATSLFRSIHRAEDGIYYGTWDVAVDVVDPGKAPAARSGSSK